MPGRLLARGLLGARLHELEEVRDAIVGREAQDRRGLFERDATVPERTVGTGAQHRAAEPGGHDQRREDRREAAGEDRRGRGARTRRPRALEPSADLTVGGARQLLVAEALERGEEPVVAHRSATTPASA